MGNRPTAQRYRDPMGSLFPEDAIIRKVSAEGALLSGGGRALLMQVAHPLVAKGVAEHSDFASNPLRRLQGTLEATYTIVFGTDEEVARTTSAVHKVHERVVGDGYEANDPALLCWVNATLADTALRVYTTLVRPLSAADQERFYEESTLVAEALGCPRSSQPDDLADFHDYVHTMVGTLEVSDTARQVAASVLHPNLPWITGPAFAAFRFVTVGMLPAPLRRQYGFHWDGRRKRILRAGGAALGRVYPLVPRPIRHAPVIALV
jgi:uncharacterized protein (DUF2236 family)